MGEFLFKTWMLVGVICLMLYAGSKLLYWPWWIRVLAIMVLVPAWLTVWAWAVFDRMPW